MIKAKINYDTYIYEKFENQGSVINIENSADLKYLVKENIVTEIKDEINIQKEEKIESQNREDSLSKRTKKK